MYIYIIPFHRIQVLLLVPLSYFLIIQTKLLPFTGYSSTSCVVLFIRGLSKM
ncbi:hypothetical protein CC78DRAFT_208785 [Lojkania enalia]|uniref:Uncharacterized protein n=1 Tax=Lojkania enalia TaxID=147567 RepID=A0A9P4K9J2_9PLEO|nr:hypothetical protein CC78DRAFT_208785 [Didymosphaeria enalia]